MCGLFATHWHLKIFSVCLKAGGEESGISLALSFLFFGGRNIFFLQVSASPVWEVLKVGGESGLSITLMRFGGFLVIWPSTLYHPITSLFVGLGALAFPLSVSTVRVFLRSAALVRKGILFPALNPTSAACGCGDESYPEPEVSCCRAGARGQT